MSISANGRTHDIERCFGSRLSPDIVIHYNEDELPRGAAGCIKDCQSWLGPDTFVVAHGASVLLNVDLQRLLDEHRRSGSVLSVAAEAGSDAADGQAVAALRPNGLYVCEPEVCRHIRQRGYQDMKEQLIPRLIEAGLRVQAVPVSGQVLGIFNEECYLNAVLTVLGDETSREPFTAHLPSAVPGLWIDRRAEIQPGSRIIGPAYVAPGARVSADAVVIGPAIIGPDSLVGRGAVVHESVLWQGACVGEEALVEQSVMARRSSVDRGVEVRSAIVVEPELTAVERQSLVAGFPGEAPGVVGRLLRRLWGGARPASQPV